ncbi:biopolymer transporter ExbD [uncultured Roseibium sp.]|uniref:ExbD/TolR family protein n=1 Tax=uncultured Roseibium sp. TaxID=1936171 RepID=UPI003218044C
MHLKFPVRRTPPENTIPLINVVFLMLIFFLFAGSIARDDARRLEPPVDITEDESIRSTGALIIDRDGHTHAQDAETSIEAWLEATKTDDTADGPLKVAADGDLPADKLEEVLSALSKAGGTNVVLITRKSAQ